jgi:hypothetical protein
VLGQLVEPRRLLPDDIAEHRQPIQTALVLGAMLW